MTLEFPQHRHNCRDCAFLGRYEDFDLYAHDFGGVQTVVARYGSDARHAHVGVAGGKLACEPIRVALDRARKRGLLKALDAFNRTPIATLPLAYLVQTLDNTVVALCTDPAIAERHRTIYLARNPLARVRIEPWRVNTRMSPAGVSSEDEACPGMSHVTPLPHGDAVACQGA